MTKIAVIGNCQVQGFALTLRALMPDAGVTVWQLAQTEAVDFNGCDIVFVQDKPNAPIELDMGSRAIAYPIVRYGGFHPGFTNGLNIPAGEIGYHSMIALGAYGIGMSAKEALDMYSAETFGAMGYLKQPEHSRRHFLEYCAGLGYDLADHLTSCFMHTTVHPTIGLLSVIAVKALAKAGIAKDVPTGLTDHLANNVCLPCLPPLADHIGVPGSWEFKRHVRYGKDRALHLGDYLEQMWRVYAEMPKEALELNPVRRTAEVLRRL
jgi:hypothetical protein